MSKSEGELIDLLIKKKNGNPPPDIPERKNIYERHPKFLQGITRPFFTQRKPMPGSKKKFNRTTDSGEGFWKNTNGAKDIKDENGKSIGQKISLTFYEGTGKKVEGPKYIMHEISCSETDLDVLCTFHKNGDNSRATRKVGESSNRPYHYLSACEELHLNPPPMNRGYEDLVHPQIPDPDHEDDNPNDMQPLYDFVRPYMSH